MPGPAELDADPPTCTDERFSGGLTVDEDYLADFRVGSIGRLGEFEYLADRQPELVSHRAGVSEEIKQHSFGEPRGAGRNEDDQARMYWRAARALTEPYYYLVAQPSAGSVSSDCRGRALGNRRRIASFQK